MRPTAAVLTPLSPDEIARLNSLAAECGVESRDFMYGVFCAAATPANRPEPTEWLPLLLRTPPSSKQALVEFSKLCFTEFAISAELLDLAEPHVPDLDDVAAVKSFCRGYMHVARLDKSWLNVNAVFNLTLPLAALAELAPLESMQTFFPEAAEGAEWLAEMRRTLPERVVNISRELRTAVPFKATPVTSEKVGRNDPCPCGSGRKYKKCCFSEGN